MCGCVAGTEPGQKDIAPAAAGGYTPPAVVGAGKAEDSANEHDDKLSEVSDKASGSAAAEEQSAADAKALEKGKGKMVQGRRTDSASSLRCASMLAHAWWLLGSCPQNASTCPVSFSRRVSMTARV